MKKIKKWLKQSRYTQPLSLGCKMCAQGSKMVLLVTGLCPANCFYCPLSYKKKGKDRIFADEWELDNEKDFEKLKKEAELIKATGAGITGGDPLVVWDRTKKYIDFLKQNFGKNFHIHLYTSGLKNSEKILNLVEAGLDEIRFHPMPGYWDKMDNSPIKKAIEKALITNVETAIEVPSIPKMEKEIMSLILWADKKGIGYVNLNELEFSETNEKNLRAKGYFEKNDISAAVKNSQETAYNILKKLSIENLSVGVHYCSSSFKDAIQLRNRIKRRAKNIARDHETINYDGLLLKGYVESEDNSLNEIYDYLIKNYNLSDKQVFISKKKKRVEIEISALKKICEKLKNKGYRCYIVEEYPTADRLETEKIPL